MHMRPDRFVRVGANLPIPPAPKYAALQNARERNVAENDGVSADGWMHGCFDLSEHFESRERERMTNVTVRTESFRMKKGFTLDQAVAEAGRCLLCHEPPCSQGCPAATDPGAFIRKLRLRNVTGAIRTIKENNILGGACGVLCPTSRLCEKACSVCGIDRPISIGKIQRFLVEHAREIGFKPYNNNRYMKPAGRAERVAVVGAGPSGLSCAAELAKCGFGVTVFEERKEPGGVLRYGVPSFRFDGDFLDRELDDLRDLGVEFRCSESLRGRGDIEALLGERFQAVFIGIGLWESARLSCDGGACDGVFPSIRFLEEFRKGDGGEQAARCRDRAVAVIGGGSVAVDCARVARALGASDVYLVYRRSFDEMPAELDERHEALEEGIHFLLLNQPVGYVADGQNRLEGVRLMRTQLGNPDASGRRSPVEIPGSEWVLRVQAVVEAIGNRPPSESPGWYPNARVTGNGLVAADAETCRTSLKGVFAGGDIVRGPATVVEAVADGKKAARAIEAYLDSQAPNAGGM